MGSTFAYCLNKDDVKFKNLEIEVEGTLKHSGPKYRLRMISIEVNIWVNIIVDSTQSFEKCVNSYKEFCPISNIIKKGTELIVNIKKKEK